MWMNNIPRLRELSGCLRMMNKDSDAYCSTRRRTGHAHRCKLLRGIDVPDLDAAGRAPSHDRVTSVYEKNGDSAPMITNVVLKRADDLARLEIVDVEANGEIRRCEIAAVRREAA